MSSSLIYALDGLEDLLVASTTFMNAVGLPTEQEVRDKRIFLEALMDDDDKLVSTLPAAAILESDHRWSPLSQGLGIQTGASGSILLMLARTAFYRDNHKKSRRDFVLWSSKIVDEMMLLVAAGNHYQFSAANLSQKAVRPPRKDRSNPKDDWWWCSYEFLFGFDDE